MKNSKVCKHLNKNLDQEYLIHFTGKNNEIVFICEKCAQRLNANIQPEVYELDENRNSKLYEYNWRQCEMPIIGSMNLPESNDNFCFDRESIIINQLAAENILTLEPHPLEATQWFVVTTSGEVLLFNIDGKDTKLLYRLEAGWIDLNEPLFLTVSMDGNFIAIANVFQTRGEIIDIDLSTQTMKLERSDYHVKHCHYPLAFVQYENKPLLIHATDWDHLDISDPATGELLVEHPDEYDSDSFDHFNHAASFRGTLMVSPGQNWIADSGWEWHPIGAVSSWSIENWIKNNPWEFNSGPSMLNHTGKDYFWDQPMCWIDNTTLCIWGWNVDDGHILPAVCLYDVETGERENWFAGPDGALVFDEYLFAYSSVNGITVWDIHQGHCVLQDTSATARAYHPAGRYFIDYTEGGEWFIHRLCKSVRNC